MFFIIFNWFCLNENSFGFVALLADSTVCVGGSNNHYESMHDTTGSYLDIRYITGLNYVPTQIYATSYTTLVRTNEDEFVEYGRGFANGNVQSQATGHPFNIIAPSYKNVKEMKIDQICLKGSMILSFKENPNLRFVFTEGGVNGILDISELFPTSIISRGKVHSACNTSYFVLYEGAERGTSMHLGRKLFEIANRENNPLCDIMIVTRDVSMVDFNQEDVE